MLNLVVASVHDSVHKLKTKGLSELGVYACLGLIAAAMLLTLLICLVLVMLM